MDKTHQALLHEFADVRTGRASAAIFEKIHVDAYGSSMPLNQVANIKIPEPQTAMIEPWDKSVMSAIEKAIMASDLGLNPSNDGSVIRVPFPRAQRGATEGAREAVQELRRGSPRRGAQHPSRREPQARAGSARTASSPRTTSGAPRPKSRSSPTPTSRR